MSNPFPLSAPLPPVILYGEAGDRFKPKRTVKVQSGSGLGQRDMLRFDDTHGRVAFPTSLRTE